MLHKLKNAAARFASGVTVVVSGRTGAVHAVTVSAFSCVSLDPPLVLVCVNTNSKIADLIEDTQAFTVNVLSQKQVEVSDRFSRPGRAPMSGLDEPHHFSITGVPILSDAVSYFECEVSSQQIGGDHVIFIGRVVDAGAQEGPPLVYFNRNYKALAPLISPLGPRV